MNRHYTFMPTNIKINCRFPLRLSPKSEVFSFLCKAFLFALTFRSKTFSCDLLSSFFSLLLASRKIAYSIKMLPMSERQCLLIIFMRRTRGRRSRYMAGAEIWVEAIGINVKTVTGKKDCFVQQTLYVN